MGLPRLSKLELQIMEAFWTQGACSVREVQESFPEKNRPAFTTVQTMIYRLEAKKALRRTKRIGKANIFEAVVSRNGVQGNLINELLNLFGTRPVVAHMVKTGQLTLEDVRDAQQELKRLARKEQSK
ncbi:MAG TPA: BlaI/MecI/CopY family transcriptional regulator [Bryobacteraceae bacterium]|jgi:BlaI family penicillinase repressor|nr:BlaI/MecI/CopY family transcriptional regulator [Bryobacteraceae bacterium]